MSIETLIAAILARMAETNKWQRRFLNHLFHLWLGIRGRLNFLNMSRQGDFTETTYHNQFHRGLNWLEFSSQLVAAHCLPERIIVFDPSHLSKSGKHTPGVGYFWSGKANRVEWGLEIGAFSVVDIGNHTAMHLLAEQTTPEKVKAAGGQMAHYCQLVEQNAPQLRQISPWLVVDSFFSRQPFVGCVKTAGLELIIPTRSGRKDAVLLYPFLGPKTGKKGRPKKFDGRVNLLELDPQHFTPCPDEEGGKLVFEARLWVKAWKAWAKVVVVQIRDENEKLPPSKSVLLPRQTCPEPMSGTITEPVFRPNFFSAMPNNTPVSRNAKAATKPKCTFISMPPSHPFHWQKPLIGCLCRPKTEDLFRWHPSKPNMPMNV